MSLTIAQAVRKILIKEPFYGLFLMGINKRFSNSIETACVEKNGINVELLINQNYWNSLSEPIQINVLLHETLHIVFKHVLMWDDYPDKDRFGIAVDCHVNSFLKDVPSDWYHPKDFGFEPMLGTKYYYENLPNNLKNKNPNHNWVNFKDLTDAEKQLINNQIDYQVKVSAEQVMKTNPGNIPGYLKDYIDQLFKKKDRLFNWKSYFRRMIGTIQDIELKKTRKKESIRFPDASGLKHKKRSNICIVVDTSGSISNKDLVDFFAEIYHVWKAGTEVTIIENDTTIEKISKYNGKWNKEIHGRGGTAFNDCVEWYNQRRKEFNTIIFFTDGYADVDLNISGPSIWVITSDGKHQKYPGQTLYIPKNS